MDDINELYLCSNALKIRGDNLLKRLEKLKTRKEISLSFEGRKGSYSFKKLLIEIPIYSQFITVIRQYFRPCSKSTKLLDCNAACLISYLGGLHKSTVKLDELMNNGYTWANFPLEEFYLDDLYYFLKKLKSVVNKRKPIKEKTTFDKLPFCCLCANVPRLGKGYCNIHCPSDSYKNYLRAKRRLLKVIKNHNPQYKREVLEYEKGILSREDFPNRLYKWSMSFTSESSQLRQNFDNAQHFKNKIYCLMELVKNHYKYTYSKISTINIDNCKSWKEFHFIVVKTLLPKQEYDWGIISNKRWEYMNYGKTGESYLYLLIKRYESINIINNLATPKTVKNEDLRKNIIALIQQQKNEAREVNQNEISKILGISRQRVSVLFKESQIKEVVVK